MLFLSHHNHTHPYRSADAEGGDLNQNDTIRNFKNPLYHKNTSTPNQNDKITDDQEHAYDIIPEPVSRAVNGNEASNTTRPEVKMQNEVQTTNHRDGFLPCKTSADGSQECSYVNLNQLSRSKLTEKKESHDDEHLYHTLEQPS